MYRTWASPYSCVSNAYGTLQSHYVWRNNSIYRPRHQTMNNGPWISSDVQARIEPPPIPLVKLELEDEHATHIIKVKIQTNQSQAASDMYNININTFNDVQPEEFLALLKNFKITIDGTGTSTLSGRISYLHTILRGQRLREFDKLQSHYGGPTNNHLNLIQEVLLEYFFPINSLSNQKRAIRRAMRKTRIIKFKCFAARLTEMKNLLPLFPGLDVTKKITHEDLN